MGGAKSGISVLHNENGIVLFCALQRDHIAFDKCSRLKNEC